MCERERLHIYGYEYVSASVAYIEVGEREGKEGGKGRNMAKMFPWFTCVYML